MFDEGLNDYVHNARRRSALASLDRLLQGYATGQEYDGFYMPMLALRITSEGEIMAYRRWPGVRPKWRTQRLDRLDDRRIAIVTDALRRAMGYVPRHGA